MSTNALTLDDQLQEHTRRLIDTLSQHPFLVRCRQGQADVAALKTLLVQQGLYSSHFTRYLCAMMASLPEHAQVMALADNLFEELGLAADAPTPHHVLYTDMLSGFGLSLQGQAMNPGTRRLVEAMYFHCRQLDPVVGIAALCLGAEALVPSFYADIVRGFEALGVARERLVFFHVHMQCDDAHALTLHRMLVEHLTQDPTRLDKAVATGRALVEARCAFLDDVARSARQAQPDALAV